MMVNNSANINKTSNRLSSQFIGKKHDIRCWKSKSWLGTGTKMLRGCLSRNQYICCRI